MLSIKWLQLRRMAVAALGTAGAVCLLLSSIPAALAGASGSPTQAASAHKGLIVDSNMAEAEAFDGLNPQCPDEIRKRQRVVTVRYYSADMKVHQGQLVVDADLEKDVRTVFEKALDERFPIHSVIPISDKRFRKDGQWDDELSMEANNTSAFNYRLITGSSTQLSKHAYGRAIDINPYQNPYIKDLIILPKDARYDTSVKGTFTADDPIVRTFVQLGWEWGGSWTTRKDYQHFEKPLAEK